MREGARRARPRAPAAQVITAAGRVARRRQEVRGPARIPRRRATPLQAGLPVAGQPAILMAVAERVGAAVGIAAAVEGMAAVAGVAEAVGDTTKAKQQI